MRYTLAREGIDTPVGYHYKAGAIKFEADKEYSVFWTSEFSADDQVIGVATDFRRDEEGLLTAEVVWVGEHGPASGDLVDEGQAFLTIYANEVDKTGRHPRTWGDPQSIVNSCTIKALYICVDAIHPWTPSPYQPVKGMTVVVRDFETDEVEYIEATS